MVFVPGGPGRRELCQCALLCAAGTKALVSGPAVGPRRPGAGLSLQLVVWVD